MADFVSVENREKWRNHKTEIGGIQEKGEVGGVSRSMMYYVTLRCDYLHFLHRIENDERTKVVRGGLG